jgi:hypothetical protein
VCLCVLGQAFCALTDYNTHLGPEVVEAQQGAVHKVLEERLGGLHLPARQPRDEEGEVLKGQARRSGRGVSDHGSSSASSSRPATRVMPVQPTALTTTTTTTIITTTTYTTSHRTWALHRGSSWCAAAWAAIRKAGVGSWPSRASETRETLKSCGLKSPMRAAASFPSAATKAGPGSTSSLASALVMVEISCGFVHSFIHSFIRITSQVSTEVVRLGGGARAASSNSSTHRPAIG